MLKESIQGLPWCLSSIESACKCQRYGLDAWSGMILHILEQPSRCTTTAERPWCWKDWRQEEKGTAEDEMAGWHHWLYGHELGKLWEMVKDTGARWAAVHGVSKSWTWLSSWTTATGYGSGGLTNGIIALLRRDSFLSLSSLPEEIREREPSLASLPCWQWSCSCKNCEK